MNGGIQLCKMPPDPQACSVTIVSSVVVASWHAKQLNWSNTMHSTSPHHRVVLHFKSACSDWMHAKCLFLNLNDWMWNSLTWCCYLVDNLRLCASLQLFHVLSSNLPGLALISRRPPCPVCAWITFCSILFSGEVYWRVKLDCMFEEGLRWQQFGQHYILFNPSAVTENAWVDAGLIKWALMCLFLYRGRPSLLLLVKPPQ